MNERQFLKINLPEGMADLPVKIIRGGGNRQLVLSVEQEEHTSFAFTHEKRYAFIWRQNDYLKVALADILWVEAAGSYSMFHLSGGKTMMISFNLAVIEKKLPSTDFMRIHRSYIVNLQHVVSLVGNSLRIDGRLLIIGRIYRAELFDRFIFLGVRRDKTAEISHSSKIRVVGQTDGPQAIAPL